jgi:hypothetical protein
MSSVCLIDTSIFLNLLDVPYCNQSRAEVAQDFEMFTAKIPSNPWRRSSYHWVVQQGA